MILFALLAIGLAVGMLVTAIVGGKTLFLLLDLAVFTVLILGFIKLLI